MQCLVLLMRNTSGGASPCTIRIYGSLAVWCFFYIFAVKFYDNILDDETTTD